MTQERAARCLRLCALACAVLVFAFSRGGLSRRGGFSAAAQEAKPFDQQQKLAELNKQIEGREQQPAEQVFKNIQTLKGVPAKRLPLVMNAYTRALGVSCAYCHTVDQWEKEDKPAKQAARDMMRMVAAVNNDHIKNMKTIVAGASVSCSTCHRGRPHPDSRLPEAKTN
jgi:DNA-binding transcriptional regulator YiaG